MISWAAGASRSGKKEPAAHGRVPYVAPHWRHGGVALGPNRVTGTRIYPKRCAGRNLVRAFGKTCRRRNDVHRRFGLDGGFRPRRRHVLEDVSGNAKKVLVIIEAANDVTTSRFVTSKRRRCAWLLRFRLVMSSTVVRLSLPAAAAEKIEAQWGDSAAAQTTTEEGENAGVISNH